MLYAQQQALMAGVTDPAQLIAMQQALMMNGGGMQLSLEQQSQLLAAA